MWARPEAPPVDRLALALLSGEIRSGDSVLADAADGQLRLEPVLEAVAQQAASV